MKDMENSSEENDDTELLYQRIRTQERGKELLPLAEAEISRICGELNAAQSIETVAKAIYRRTIRNNVIHNRSIADIAPSAVFIACRVENDLRPLGKVVEVSYSSERDITRTHADLSRELKINTEPVNPKDYIHRFCTELNLSEEEELKAKEMLDTYIDEEMHVGKSPSSVAAASIYAAALLYARETTQREVASVAGVSDTTIGKRYQELIVVCAEAEK
ncbi:hypothetical protein ACLI4R_18910 [Natrialbaceae archaeon A-chndr2]